MNTAFYLSLAIFVVTYAIIISEKIHRTVIALAGAVLMIALGILSQEQAIEAIDFNTLGLLIGMMVVVSIAKQSGMFQYVAIWASKISRGKPLIIFCLLSFITALFSAFLDNVTTVLLIIPVTFVIANQLKIHPKPFLIAAILLANIGGVATLIGDPPNIMIGSASGLGFNAFLFNLGPISLIVAIVTIGLLLLTYRKKLITSPEARAAIMKFDPKEAITDKKLLIKSLVVLGVVIVGFFIHGTLHLEGATIALFGAALMLLLTMHDPEHSLREVEWTTIFFFTGLFILVGGLEEVGVIHKIADLFVATIHNNPVSGTIGLLWMSAIVSAVIDNIPFVATMIPIIQNIGQMSSLPLTPLWWALALGADIGGNATLIGASANVIVAGMAAKEDKKIGFFEYLKIAVPMTLVALILCTVYMYFRYLV
ncbi:MAG: hypothetical protein A2233_01820 [Candidatus Kerfeldbacteria bacterium RIFOXYA2_FULL_38_24]|uniref:Citrate transporter-like domain-containing protein n=1 Tax=Candidatus Kerfeldbacteria bacterium RIFOXYB2_FULL_38_14 TaxID=1798547 RepID=A0A1G2BG42_9BACT|nr:MAG: hypothetical protein A2319_04425 [Candidatus Kerfeldbacteria bacterium RIFOXYB2_FULL_38_14]OGY87855.1 MAG: hypothetical protein A2233_01820 [Candidatus Kerfeldbacteria bacterium RIFOXYA2_FULL_38_24]OGY88506.1 MAG: hypothetical protein A2458_01925 [Candidatus Kerfeldbacteria bacterium RIFOXYC2_FULL_38_9]